MRGLFYKTRGLKDLRLREVGRRWPQAVAVVAALARGYILGDQSSDAEPLSASFHDIRVIHPEDFQDLIAPEAPEVVALARRLG